MCKQDTCNNGCLSKKASQVLCSSLLFSHGGFVLFLLFFSHGGFVLFFIIQPWWLCFALVYSSAMVALMCLCYFPAMVALLCFSVFIHGGLISMLHCILSHTRLQTMIFVKCMFIMFCEAASCIASCRNPIHNWIALANPMDTKKLSL